MGFFDDCKTLDDVKRTFKELAKKHHPDCGGDADTFKAMIQDYERAFNRCKNIRTSTTGETYEKATTETAAQYADIISAFIHVDDLTIEIIGSWVWITGNTYKYKDDLAAHGFIWSYSKKAWYNPGEKLQGKRRGHYSMNKLRERYGSEVVETEKQERIA